MPYLIIYGFPWFILVGLATALWPGMPSTIFPWVSGGALATSVVLNWKVRTALTRRLGPFAARLVWGMGMLGLAFASVAIAFGDASDRAIAAGCLVVALALGGALVGSQRKGEAAEWAARRARLEPFRLAARNREQRLGAAALRLIFVPRWTAATPEMHGHNFAIVTGLLSTATLEAGDRRTLEDLRERLAEAIRADPPGEFDQERMEWLIGLCERMDSAR